MCSRSRIVHGLCRALIDLPLNCVLDQLPSAAECKLLLEVGLVGLDGLHAQVQLVRNLACASAFADGTKDFELAIRECAQASLQSCGRAADVLLQHLVCDAIAQI